MGLAFSMNYPKDPNVHYLENKTPKREFNSRSYQLPAPLPTRTPRRFETSSAERPANPRGIPVAGTVFPKRRAESKSFFVRGQFFSPTVLPT